MSSADIVKSCKKYVRKFLSDVKSIDNVIRLLSSRNNIRVPRPDQAFTFFNAGSLKVYKELLEAKCSISLHSI